MTRPIKEPSPSVEKWERGGLNSSTVVNSNNNLPVKKTPKKMRISEERALILEIVQTTSEVGARLLLQRLTKRLLK